MIEKGFDSDYSGEKKPQREPSLEASMKQIHQTSSNGQNQNVTWKNKIQIQAKIEVSFINIEIQSLKI